jgi:hypothetical protein
MNANMMDHEQAMKNLTAERYLLGELTGNELEAYEEHLFTCSACFEQVSLGAEFIGQLRQSGAQEFVPAHAVKPGFVPSLLASFRQPAPALAFGLLLCVGGFSVYQNSVISRLKGPRPDSPYVLTGIAHGAGDSLQVSRNGNLSLSVEYAPKGEFVSYNARVLTESGKMKHVLELPSNQPPGMASITVPAEALQPGKYTIIISGRTSDGTENEVARCSFELQFTDK